MGTEVLGRVAVRRVKPGHRTQERVFYCLMTLLTMGTILLGFRKFYFPLGVKPAALSSWVIVVHGIVFSVFLLLFGVQVALIATRRVKLHMTLGLTVYGLAVLMIPLGVVSAADEIRRDLMGTSAFPVADPYTFSLVSVMGMVMFGTLLALSYVWRRRPEMHKRLALYAVLSMMDAGIDRWPWAAWGLSPGWSHWVYTGLLLLPVAYDLLSQGRVVAVTMVAAPFVWCLERLEIPLGETRAWHWVAHWMLKHLT
jgi:hypothetical protein